MDIHKAFELADWFWTLHPDERRSHYWLVAQFIKDIYRAGYTIETRYITQEDVAMQPVREDTEDNAINSLEKELRRQ